MFTFLGEKTLEALGHLLSIKRPLNLVCMQIW